ncbi:MAG: hypothetical protein OXC62_13005 [Aestuariivita sp.]|nr:hypothetical protein [Aestuariivita sp.]
MLQMLAHHTRIVPHLRLWNDIDDQSIYSETLLIAIEHCGKDVGVADIVMGIFFAAAGKHMCQRDEGEGSIEFLPNTLLRLCWEIIKQGFAGTLHVFNGPTS